MSLITSTGGVALLPAYAKTFLPTSVTTRPLEGATPRIDLCLGYRKDNGSSILKLLLARADELVANMAKSYLRT
jgi:LysR family transcriptional regulator, hca operon transcriptional activator